SAASVPSAIGRQDLYWGRDSKLVGSVKSWNLGGVEDLGQVRIAAYDGKSRLQGLRTAEAGTQAEITAWRSWLDNRANIETLQDPTVDAQAATAGLGRWRSFERNSLGSLETERLDGITDWSGTRYANGPGLSSVVLPDGTVSALGWSGRGLLEMDGTRSVAWTPDEQVASVNSAYTPPGTSMSLAGSEQRIYDGYGRVVRIVRNGEVLDRVYAGAEVIREVSSCGERAWWPSGDLDEPVAYSLRWEPSCTEAALDPVAYDLQLELVDLSRAGF